MSERAPAAGVETAAAPATDQTVAAAATAEVDAALQALPFDAALAELQGVVARLEQGGLPLEESIALYERGVALHDQCARLLSAAELRVQKLVESAGGALRALDLTPEDADEP
ncbi:MAG: exodeoxyribonuclease VII small subunit [Candidatus Limnocylindrales bacterium]